MKTNEAALRRKLGNALKGARLAQGLTQNQVAEAVETDPETISRFERGVTLPSLSRLLDLASALGVTVAAVLGAASPRPTDEWDQLMREVARLSAKDQALALALVRTLVEVRAK